MKVEYVLLGGFLYLIMCVLIDKVFEKIQNINHCILQVNKLEELDLQLSNLKTRMIVSPFLSFFLVIVIAYLLF